MRVKVFIFGTLFLIGNITLNAQLLVREGMVSVEEIATLSHGSSTVRDDLEAGLTQRGIDNNVAHDIVEDFLKENDVVAMLKMQNYLNVIKQVDYEMLINEIIIELLFGNAVDFSSYDTLVALTQRLYGVHLDAALLEQLIQVASVNQSLEVT